MVAARDHGSAGAGLNHGHGRISPNGQVVACVRRASAGLRCRASAPSGRDTRTPASCRGTLRPCIAWPGAIKYSWLPKSRSRDWHIGRTANDCHSRFAGSWNLARQWQRHQHRPGPGWRVAGDPYPSITNCAPPSRVGRSSGGPVSRCWSTYTPEPLSTDQRWYSSPHAISSHWCRN